MVTSLSILTVNSHVCIRHIDQVIRDDFMARDPDNPNFNITALCKLE